MSRRRKRRNRIIESEILKNRIIAEARGYSRTDELIAAMIFPFTIFNAYTHPLTSADASNESSTVEFCFGTGDAYAEKTNSLPCVGSLSSSLWTTVPRQKKGLDWASNCAVNDTTEIISSFGLHLYCPRPNRTSAHLKNDLRNLRTCE